MSELSKRIKRLMAENQITVQTLAELCSISTTYLYRIVRDEVDPKSLSLGKLEEIARGLNVSLVKLLHDPGLKDIDVLRLILSDDDLDLLEAIDKLAPNDWKRKAILELLEITFTVNSTVKNRVDD